MSKLLPKLAGFKEFTFSTESEEMGKEIRDFCAEHHVSPGKVAAKIVTDYFISRGIVTGQPMPAIDALRRLDERANDSPL